MNDESGDSMEQPTKTVSVDTKDKIVSEKETDSLIRPMERKEEEQTMKTNKRIVIAVYIVLVVLGIGTGYLLAGRPGLFKKTSTGTSVVTSGTIVGSTDTKTFKDSAEGTIEKGGADGEGSHKLIREGGPSQTAYLISSVVDLDQFAGKKVRVWGQTMAAKSVSWLMDVGKVELLSQ